MKDLFYSIFTKEVIIKFLIWTIPWKLVSWGIFMISWWNIIWYFILLFLERKYWVKIDNPPYYIWFYLILIWLIWYFFDKIKFNNKYGRIPEYLNFEHEYRNLLDSWKGEFTKLDDQEQVITNNRREIETVLYDNQIQAIQFKEFVDNNNCYLLQIIWKKDYVRKFIIWFCNIETEKRKWFIINWWNELKDIISSWLEWIILLSNNNYSDKIWNFLNKWNTLVIETDVEIDKIPKIILSNTKEKPSDFNLYSN